MKGYIWSAELLHRYGSVNVRDDKKLRDECSLKKKYVSDYLSPCVHFAGCGWNGCEYMVIETSDGREIGEFIRLYAEKSDAHNMSGRFICVSANSPAAICEAVFDNIF